MTGVIITANLRTAKDIYFVKTDFVSNRELNEKKNNEYFLYVRPWW